MSALRANVEALAVSGTAVSGHGETMATAHAAADGQVSCAQAGWQGTSAAALAAKAATWTKTTGALLARLSDHAQGLHTGAAAYVEGEERSSAVMEQVAAEGDAAAVKR